MGLYIVFEYKWTLSICLKNENHATSPIKNNNTKKTNID